MIYNHVLILLKSNKLTVKQLCEMDNQRLQFIASKPVFSLINKEKITVGTFLRLYDLYKSNDPQKWLTWQ